MQFDTKIAVVIRTDLEAWQKLNVACVPGRRHRGGVSGMHRRSLTKTAPAPDICR